MRRISIVLFLILMTICSPITIASESSEGLEYFEKTEDGYLLPYKHEQDLVNFINGLNNRIVELEDALKEERNAHEDVIQIKNERIDNLENQIETLGPIKSNFEDIVENKDKIITNQDEQITLLDDVVKDYQETESINQSIINNYENKIQAKDRLLAIEKEKNLQNLVRFTSYSFVAGVIVGIIAK